MYDIQIVYTDQNRENIRIDIQYILLPAGLEVWKLVTVGSPVEELVILFWIFRHVMGGADIHIAVPIDVIRVSRTASGNSFPAPVAVSNRIADIQDLFTAGCDDRHAHQ